ncbi:MAG: hypothetical protein K2H18_01500 [Muribaculaceae bacterium]|nr:hypothetical protein [Muribaculaceae bacterium]
MGCLEERGSAVAPGILYVVVLYRQRLFECNAFKSLLADRRNVFIYDNSPDATAPDNLPEGWRYVSDPANPGLSVAYNEAAKYATEHGFKWMMITDQDTEYASGAAERYEKLPQSYPDEEIFIPRVKVSGGLFMSPVPKRNYMPSLEKVPLTGSIDLSKSAVINSGLLIKLDSFEKSGGYNEKVFLDFSDFQFIDRFSAICKKGMVTEEMIEQSFSANDDKGEMPLKRFRLFCRSLRGYEKKDFKTRLGIGLAVIKRCMSLSRKLHTSEAVKIYVEDYLRPH